MVRRPIRAVIVRFTRSPAFPPFSNNTDPGLVWRWCVEEALSRIRWLAVPTCLLTIERHPDVWWPLVLLVAAAFAIGNYDVSLGLRGGTDAIVATSRLATALDWAGVTWLTVILATHTNSAALVGLPVLILTSTLRAHWLGLALSTGAAMVVIMGTVALQLLVHGHLTSAEATLRVMGWASVIAATAFIARELLRVSDGWRRWQIARDRSSTDARATQVRLSEREQQVLSLLAQPGLTYAAIAECLYVSPETIKTHVARIGRKLGVSGRRAVVAVARERGLLPRDGLEKGKGRAGERRYDARDDRDSQVDGEIPPCCMPIPLQGDSTDAVA